MRAPAVDLRALLPKEHVLLDLPSGIPRAEALRQTMQPLLASGIVTDSDAFLHDLEEREAKVTTQAEFGVAFPHARSKAATRLGAALATIASPGIAYTTGGAENVRVLFLIAVPSFAPAAHLSLLEHFAVFAQDPSRIERLLACRTQAQATTLLQRFRRRR